MCALLAVQGVLRDDHERRGAGDVAGPGAGVLDRRLLVPCLQDEAGDRTVEQARDRVDDPVRVQPRQPESLESPSDARGGDRRAVHEKIDQRRRTENDRGGGLRPDRVDGVGHLAGPEPDAVGGDLPRTVTLGPRSAARLPDQEHRRDSGERDDRRPQSKLAHVPSHASVPEETPPSASFATPELLPIRCPLLTVQDPRNCP
jgi:hypothetical protein